MTLVERRIGLLLLAFCVLLAVAGLRALQLGAIDGPELSRAATGQQASEIGVPAQRGTITDRRGVELAVSEPAEDVSATPYLIKDPAKTARLVAPLVGRPLDEVLRKLTDRRKGFVYLGRKVPGRAAAKIRKLEIEGIDTVPGTRRAYPEQSLAAQLIGTVGTEGKGLSGLEYARDGLLHGRDGERHLVKDAVGKPISLRDARPARAGRDLQLTLDAAIQDQAEDVLAGVGRKFQPKGATALVMDPRSGDLLALANWPRVNANDLGSAPPYATQNRAVGAAYEPGSTFKAFTVAGALEDGRVERDTSFGLAPQIQVADRTIGESHPRGPVTLTTAEILAQSSNVGAITIGLRSGKKRFDHWVRRFGFGATTRTDLPGEERGIVPEVSEYSGSSMGNLPIGQGLSVTPMQMAVAYSAIANGGILRPARVVDKVGGRKLPATKGRRVISRRTAASIREMLEGVLAAGGTAAEATIPGYQLAGKTGTANKPDPKTGGYSETKYVASFMGFAPARNPRLLVAVMVDEPGGGNIFGGEVAAPAFQRIMSFALPYLRIPPS